MSETSRAEERRMRVGAARRLRALFDMRLSDENLRSRTVISADGQVVGEITLLYLDGRLSVDAFVVTLRKDVADRIGADRSIFRAGTLEIPTRLVQSVGDAVVLTASVDDLRTIVPGEQAAFQPQV